MSVNSSSTSNSVILCRSDEISVSIYVIIVALKILLVFPLSTFVLYLGHQRWRQQGSSKTTTHSDIFTYHVAVTQLIWILGSFCFFAGFYTNQVVLLMAGIYVSSIPLLAENCFHILTCVERYLAVVHPITYRGLRNARGVRIRNICIGCVWLLCFGLATSYTLNLRTMTFIPFLCFLLFSIITMSFCSLSVLCVLIRPGPGEGGGEKQRVDQSKQRAFYTITVILVTVWLWFAGLLLSAAVSMSPVSESVRCLVMSNVSWLNLPSCLVSPLLYLHRAGKLSCCC